MSSSPKNNSTERLSEPLLEKSNDRFIQLPLKYPKLQNAYLEHQALFWNHQEIDYAADLKDWQKLSDDEQYFIEMILAFFSGSDGIVLENIMSNFSTEVTSPEARNFYSFQALIENVHALTYANLLDTLITDETKKEKLFNSIDTIPCVKKKADWAMKWMDPKTAPFEQRLVTFACIEGIFFSGSFCAIFWLKDRGLMTKALGGSNELIARDEGLHTDFAILLHEHLNNKLDLSIIREIIMEAVDIEKEFICDSLKCDLIGMNSKLMKQYIEFVADRLMVKFGGSEIYHSENPFDFMARINMNSKTNFFEKRNNDYQHSNFNSSEWDKVDNQDNEEW
jgi:ribonucleotide reductase beta subunit family protein with ferritin-like domain